MWQVFSSFIGFVIYLNLIYYKINPTRWSLIILFIVKQYPPPKVELAEFSRTWKINLNIRDLMVVSHKLNSHNDILTRICILKYKSILSWEVEFIILLLTSLYSTKNDRLYFQRAFFQIRRWFSFFLTLCKKNTDFKQL